MLRVTFYQFLDLIYKALFFAYLLLKKSRKLLRIFGLADSDLFWLYSNSLMFQGTLSPADSASVDTHLAESATLDSSKQAGAKTKKKRSANRKKVSVKESFPDYLQEAFFGRTLMEDGPRIDVEEAAPGRPSLSVNIEIPETPKVAAVKSGATGRPLVSSADSRHHETASDEQRTLDHIKQSLTQPSMNLAVPAPTELPMAVEDDDFPDFVDGDGGLDFLAGDLQDAGGVDELLAMLTAEQEDEVPAHEEELVTQTAQPRLTEKSEDPISDNFGSLWESIQGADLPQMSCEDADNVLNDVFLNEEANVTMLRSAGYLGSANVSSEITAQLQRANSLPASISITEHMGLAPWGTNGSVSVDESGESAEQSAVQKNLLRHQEDEALGEMATLSAVLYANVTHPDLNVNFPEWPERYKQIQKLWRKANADDKKPFSARARENAKLSKSVKAQKVKEEKEKTANAAAGLADVRPAVSSASFPSQMQPTQVSRLKHSNIILKESAIQLDATVFIGQVNIRTVFFF